MTLDEPVRRYLAHAVHSEAGRARGVALTMKGRIKVGTWLPFTARETCDGRSVQWRAPHRAGRAALESVFAPMSLLPERGVRWGSEDGGVVVPSAVTVGWWFGTPRYAPFFEAEIVTLEAS
jgi:hypothetical protein